MINNSENVIKSEESYISAEEFFGRDGAKARKNRLEAKNGTRRLYYYKSTKKDSDN